MTLLAHYRRFPSRANSGPTTGFRPSGFVMDRFATRRSPTRAVVLESDPLRMATAEGRYRIDSILRARTASSSRTRCSIRSAADAYAGVSVRRRTAHELVSRCHPRKRSNRDLHSAQRSLRPAAMVG